MNIEQELASVTPPGATLLTIGVFDGVHAGHRYLLGQLRHRAAERRLLTGVVTFNPHPQSVLRPDRQLACLSSPEDRVATLKQLGTDVVAVLTFTADLAQLSAREFMSLLKEYLRMMGVLVGPDFALGRDREGDANLLHSLGQQMGFSVEIVPPYTINAEVVSSTLIREALAQGDMGRAETLLGRRFYLKGVVTASDRRGRTLGFPTANLDMKPQQALPSDGTYATITHVNGRLYASATNIGLRPTFREGKRTVETYLLNYGDDLYAKEITVEFVQKLREEQCFSSSQELKGQIEKDVQQVKRLLGGYLG